jgi:hypothetical protein
MKISKLAPSALLLVLLQSSRREEAEAPTLLTG